jgi:hypothetical protein
MKRYSKPYAVRPAEPAFMAGIALLCAGLLLSPVEAEVVIRSFDNWAPKGAPYQAWAGGTLTAGPEAYTVQANDFGGIFDYLGQVDASGTGTLRLKADVLKGNAGLIVVLEDADGTANRYAW